MVLSDRAAFGASARSRARREVSDRGAIRASIATHRALFSEASQPCCDLCGVRVVGTPEGRGLFVWSRDGERRYEEPPLCETCAPKIARLAMQRFEDEDDEEG